LVALLNPLANILHSLRTNSLPKRISLPDFGNMSLKLGAVKMLFEHPIVPLMQRNAVVVNYPGGVNLPLEASIPLVLIELKLQGFHMVYASISIDQSAIPSHGSKLSAQQHFS
jgi:hypothetical protein